MKTQTALEKKISLPPKLKVIRPPRNRAKADVVKPSMSLSQSVLELRSRYEGRWTTYRQSDRKMLLNLVRSFVNAIRTHKGQEIDPVKRREEKMRLYNATFLKLRELNNGLNAATQQATGLYRELASECRRLLILGVDKQILTRELIEAGRTASRASELLSVAAMTDAHFERFMSGEMVWKLALETSRYKLGYELGTSQLDPFDQLQQLAGLTQDGPLLPQHSSTDLLFDPPERACEQGAPLLSPAPPPPALVPVFLPGLGVASAPLKPSPLSLTLGEQKAVAVAKLRLELVKLAKLSRRSFIESATEYEIGGFKITIEPLKQ